MATTRLAVTEGVRIPVPGSSAMAGYLARPADADRPPAVIVGMELFGVTAHVRDVCDRLAALGYAALAPDLYHRLAPGTELAADADGRARGFTLLRQLTRQDVLDDLRAAIGFIHARGSTLLGMVGLSVGGHFAYLAATQLDLPAAVVLYGGWIPTTDIPVSRPEPTIAATSSITGQVLILVGENDPIVPPEHRRALVDALHTAGVDHELIEYPRAGHGFLCDRRDSYHPVAAGQAWHRIADFLSETADRHRSDRSAG